MTERAGNQDFAATACLSGPTAEPLTLDAFIGRQIWRARSAQRVAILDLAKVLNLPVETLARFESGAEHIEPTTLFDIASVLELRIGFFFGIAEDARATHPRGPQ